MASLRWRLILNGKCADDMPLREAVAVMREAGIAVDVRVTWESGDIERYVAEAIEDGADTVIAAGGDGTLSEVAGALAARNADVDTSPTIGLIPLGTANDFASSTFLPVDPLEGLRLIQTRPARAIDVLRITADGATRWCVNVMSGGFSAKVSANTSAGLKQNLGGIAYLLTGIAELGTMEPLPARVSASEFDWKGEFIAMACGNGRQAGGGHVLCPDAYIDDGLLDITIVPPPSGDLLATLGTLLRDSMDAALEEAAVRKQSRSFEIHASQPFDLTLDGESFTASSLRVECIPRRLRLHLPLGCPLISVDWEKAVAAAADQG